MTTWNMKPLIISAKLRLRELDNKGYIFNGLSKQGNLAPRKVAHLGPTLAEVSPSDGATQRNGDHCFLMGED